MRFELTTRAASGLGLVLLVFAMVVLVANPGHAANERDRARAIALFERSEQLYRDGDLEQARALLLEAYALDPSPVLQYNLGRVYEGLGKLEEAARAFRLYLEGVPDVPDRGAIERRIQALEAQVAERKALRNRRPPAQPAPRPLPPPREKQEQHADSPVAPWIVAGVGAVILAGAGVSALLANRAHESAVDDPSFQGAQSSQDRAETLATLANVGFAVGGAAVAVGVGWGVLGSSDSATAPPGAAGRLPASVVLRGSF